MKYIFFLTFFLLISCVTNSNTFMCGNRACIDKKEFNEYFAKNLSIEVKTKKSKKNTSIDLVALNSDKNSKNIKREISTIQNKKNNQKNEKLALRAKKKRVKEERKLQKIKEKKRIKEEKKKTLLNKYNKNKNEASNFILNKKDEPTKKIIKKKIIEQTSVANKTFEDTITYKKVTSKKQINLCDVIADCDIDKLAELILERNNEKKFPSLNKK